MKEFISPEQILAFNHELDAAELFAQLDYLDSLWEPAVGNMLIIETWRKKKIPVVIAEVDPNSHKDFGDNTRFYCFNPRTRTYGFHFKNDSLPLFSVGKLIEMLGAPDIKHYKELDVWEVSIPITLQTYASKELCDALWDAVKDRIKNYSVQTVI